MKDIKDWSLLKKLCNCYGASGNEQNVCNIIQEEIKNYVEDIKIDSLGNLIAFKKGKNSRTANFMVCAHMDEVGFIITGITKDGYLTFEVLGGIDKKFLHGINVTIGEKNTPGVIGINPIHLTENSKKSIPLKTSQMLIDIGAKNEEDALKHINIGDYSCYDADVFDTSCNKIRAKSLDDRSGCSLLIELIKNDLEYDTYFAFTVQEEIGLKGALTVGYNIKPEKALVIETTTAYDIPDIDVSKQICNLDKGPAVSFMDRYTIYDKIYYNLVHEIAKKNDIPLQVKRGVSGGNDAGSISSYGQGVRTICLSLPCRYLHCPVSVVSQNDYLNLYKIALLLVNNKL